MMTENRQSLWRRVLVRTRLSVLWRKVRLGSTLSRVAAPRGGSDSGAQPGASMGVFLGPYDVARERAHDWPGTGYGAWSLSWGPLERDGFARGCAVPLRR